VVFFVLCVVCWGVVFFVGFVGFVLVVFFLFFVGFFGCVFLCLGLLGVFWCVFLFWCGGGGGGFFWGWFGVGVVFCVFVGLLFVFVGFLVWVFGGVFG
jgi:hypothetical protein